MRVNDILRVKGSDTITLAPETTISDLIGVLADRGIGAVIVSSDASTVEGIVSERDVVRALARSGVGVLSETIASIATHQVETVALDTRTDELMRLMTDRRIRHVPVVSDGALQGIVSIGDVVKSRIDELESERSALNDYISTAN